MHLRRLLRLQVKRQVLLDISVRLCTRGEFSVIQQLSCGKPALMLAFSWSVGQQ